MGAPLHRADGSATYSANGYTVLGSVNGPIEVQRRDELAEEAAIEIHIRPASGVGGMFFSLHPKSPSSVAI
jgi:exosome complex component RRP46